MKTFADSAGRTWTVAINVDAIKRVKGLLSVNLLDAIEGKLLERLVADPVLLCDVLFALCKPQADAQKVSDEDFGRAMAGDAIDTATTALLEELVSFFPKGRRELLAKALGKLRKLESVSLAAGHQRLDSPELEERLRKILQESDFSPEKAAGGSSGNSPASSESIQAP